jgi:hypothetical protein
VRRQADVELAHLAAQVFLLHLQQRLGVAALDARHKQADEATKHISDTAEHESSSIHGQLA